MTALNIPRHRIPGAHAIEPLASSHTWSAKEWRPPRRDSGDFRPQWCVRQGNKSAGTSKIIPEIRARPPAECAHVRLLVIVSSLCDMNMIDFLINFALLSWDLPFFFIVFLSMSKRILIENKNVGYQNKLKKNCMKEELNWLFATSSVRSNSFRFDSIFDSKGAETFQFDSIFFNLRFDSIENLAAVL